MAAVWTLKLRAPDTQTLLRNVDPDQSLGAFRQLVSTATGVAAEGIGLLSGQPPKATTQAETTPIRDIFSDRETLTVQPAPGSESDVLHAAVAAVALCRSGSKRNTELIASATEASGGDSLAGFGSLLSLAALPVSQREVAAPILGSFRRALRRERLKREEHMLAEKRQAAVFARDYEFVAPLGQTTSGRLPSLRVRFRTSPRKWIEEEYGVLPELLLRLVVYQIRHDEQHCENLRPYNMALASPRVFWNLIRCFPDATLEEALQRLLPEEDWDYLSTRKRLRSEKARENEQQNAASSMPRKRPCKAAATAAVTEPSAIDSQPLGT